MSTLSSIVARVQALLNDVSALDVSTTVLIPFINMAQDDLLERMRAEGIQRARFRNSFTVTAGTTSLTPGTSPLAFVTGDAFQPDSMWEAPTGGAVQDYTPMVGPRQLPDMAQTGTLGFWDWNGGTVNLLGATVDRLVRLDWFGNLPGFGLPTDQVQVLGSTNALSYMTAEAVLRARGDIPMSQVFRDKSEEYINRILCEEIREAQTVPDRRVPMRGYPRYPIGI
jgi:hypothetical protein